jgi:hypothetical protein
LLHMHHIYMFTLFCYRKALSYRLCKVLTPLWHPFRFIHNLYNQS